MRTPEEILSYGTDIIQKHRHELYDLKHNKVLEVSDESTNQKFNYNDYGIWKHQVKDYFQEHDKDKIYKIDSLFGSFETLFYPEPLSEILGILTISINHLKNKEKGVKPDNSQTAQTTNEPESHKQSEPKSHKQSEPESHKQSEPKLIVENPKKEKKKAINLGNWFYYLVGIATIIGVIYAVMAYYK